MKKKSTIIFFALCLFLWACDSKNKENSSSSSTGNITTEIGTEEDDYVGDDENRRYKLGEINFTIEGETITIDDFGIDPYTIMTWFTPESGIEPMASVVFKSSGFKISSMVSFKDFDAMQYSYQGQKTIENGMPIVSFVNDDVTYMFSAGEVSIEDFSRKTGKVKLRVEGKVHRVVLGNPSEMKTDLPASLEIDAYMPVSNIDGTTFKTESAQKLNIQ